MIKIYVTALILAVVAVHSASAKTIDNGRDHDRSNTTGNVTLLSSKRELPHQVDIHVSYSGEYCSGSILTPNWILTNYVWCVGDLPSDLTLFFNTLDVNVTRRSRGSEYSLTLPRLAAVRKIAKSNLALLYLPTTLKFDVNVSQVALAIRPEENFGGQHAVLAGLRVNGTYEAYGDFEILSDSECSAAFSNYDPKANLCAVGPAVPCWTTQGAGLLVDWPAAPRLIGTYMVAPWDCLDRSVGEPAFFTRISHHLESIEEVIGQRVNYVGYFF